MERIALTLLYFVVAVFTFILIYSIAIKEPVSANQILFFLGTPIYFETGVWLLAEFYIARLKVIFWPYHDLPIFRHNIGTVFWGPWFIRIGVIGSLIIQLIYLFSTDYQYRVENGKTSNLEGALLFLGFVSALLWSFSWIMATLIKTVANIIKISTEDEK